MIDEGKKAIEPTAPGLTCPKCGCKHFEVVYTRPKPQRIMRRRECRHCHNKIVTFEKIQ
jgi:transcriptional regulator NrdR family protein